MHRHLVPWILGATLATGCAGTAYGTYGYGYGVDVGVYPELVYAGPGVYAVAGFNYPVYYADNYYWRYHGGRWYRSSYYTGGWQYYRRPPVVIRQIDRPHERYYRYSPRYRYDRDRPRPVYRGDQDHRYYHDRSRPVHRGSPASPPPRVDRSPPPRVDRSPPPRAPDSPPPRVIDRDR